MYTKYRAYDTRQEFQGMLDWDELNRLDREGIVHLADLIAGTEPGFVLMEYTGLNDSEDREIYENDVLEVHIEEDFSGVVDTRAVVVWDKDYGVWMLEFPEFGITTSICDGRLDDTLKVIGNTFENPELEELL